MNSQRVPDSPEQRGYYYPREARDLMGISARTLYALSIGRKIPSRRTVGRQHRYPYDEFNQFLKEVWMKDLVT